MRMEREKAHFESSAAERRKKDKNFGKMVRSVKKELSKSGRHAR
jgi:ribosome biogenesis GTPase